MVKLRKNKLIILVGYCFDLGFHGIFAAFFPRIFPRFLLCANIARPLTSCKLAQLPKRRITHAWALNPKSKQ